MTFRQRLGLNIAPIFLRIALGVTFLYAGAGKITQLHEFEGERAARLANIGVNIIPTGAGAWTPPPPTDAPDPDPDPDATDPPPVEDPDEFPAEEPAPEPPANEPEETPPAMLVSNPAGAPGVGVTQGDPGYVYTALDFPTPARAREVHQLTLVLYSAANPGVDEPQLLPQALGDGKRPMILAWTAGVAELLGGVFVLIGLAARFWAFVLAGVMAMAMWLTQIGPIVMTDAPALLGFLPPLEGFASQPWQSLLWQLSLMMAGLAVTLLGAGSLSFDRLLFGSIPAPARPAARRVPQEA